MYTQKLEMTILACIIKLFHDQMFTFYTNNRLFSFKDNYYFS